MTRDRGIEFRRDGVRLLVEVAPDTAAITQRLLDMVDAGMLPDLSVSRRVLTIAATNGTWRYRLGPKRGGVTTATLIEAPPVGDPDDS